MHCKLLSPAVISVRGHVWIGTVCWGKAGDSSTQRALYTHIQPCNLAVRSIVCLCDQSLGMECDNAFSFGLCNGSLSAWNNEQQFNGIAHKRKRNENGYLGDKSGDKDDCKAPSRLKGTCFVQLHAHKGIFQSEKWKPNGSTLYHPLSSHLLVNFEKYDQISFDEGLFFIGDESGGCLQKERGHVIHCWRFDDKEKTLFIALSYLFTNFYIFQEIVSRLSYA
ncbi:uncharacterized protein ACMZJ9_010120 isoform 2-T2 [Mantella aurantiaca]